jgi:hypothetical protein
VLGEPLLQKYAWAISDQKALGILQRFSPIVEMGAGKGYWAHLLQQQGVEIRAYDLHPPSPSEQEAAWTRVKRGDPSILLKKRKKLSSNVTLFLCYPDEGSSVGLECLNNILATATDPRDPYCRYIVHVGELIHTGCASGSPQAPWGRSSSPDFQVRPISVSLSVSVSLSLSLSLSLSVSVCLSLSLSL